MILLIVGVHSMLEYPLWYAYFLFPTAFAWGLCLAREATEIQPAAAPHWSQNWSRWVGALMVVGSLYAYWEYRFVVAIYAPAESDQSLVQRIERGQRTLLFSRHADYAARDGPGARCEGSGGGQSDRSSADRRPLDDGLGQEPACGR